MSELREKKKNIRLKTTRISRKLMYEDATHTKQHFHRFGEKGNIFLI